MPYGLKILIKDEHNARIHLVATLLAITFAKILKVSSVEWLVLGLVICFVFLVEIINSAI